MVILMLIFLFVSWNCILFREFFYWECCKLFLFRIFMMLMFDFMYDEFFKMKYLKWIWMCIVVVLNFDIK